MNLTVLAEEYETQCKVLEDKIHKLQSLLSVYRGEDLVILRKKIKIYEDMLLECKSTALLLGRYYEED